MAGLLVPNHINPTSRKAAKAHGRSDSLVEGAPQIIVTEVSPEPDTPTSTPSEPSITGPDISPICVPVILRVVHGTEEFHSETVIDSSSNGLFPIVNKELKSLRVNHNIAGNVKSKCVGILSGGKYGEKDERRLSCEKHVVDAVDKFRSGDFRTFEIQETIEISAVGSSSYRLEIRNELASKRIKGKYNGAFLPINLLQSILPKPRIEKLFLEDEELSKLHKRRINQTVTQIYEEALRLLAAIIFADIKPFGILILDFLDNDLLDAHMPFDPEQCPGFCGPNPCDYENICKNQWQVVPLDLRPYNHFEPAKYKYGYEYVLPFVEKEHLGEGGFGEVFKVKIHPAHQKIQTLGDNPYFAMKRFKKTTEKSKLNFDREVNALEHLAKQQSPHLMRLSAALQHGDDCLLFFPLAQCNLKNCFEEDHQGDKSYLTWMFFQLLGLTKGVRTIHGDSNTLSPDAESSEIIGYHHDLKPENILLREMDHQSTSDLTELEKKYGRLLISDFGLGRFREAATGSVSVAIKGTPTYAAPESRTEKGQSRPYDIWSFGCMVIEILVWLLEGPTGLRSFTESRDAPIKSGEEHATTDCYWLERSNSIILNEAVQDEISCIREQTVFPELTGVMNDLMDVVHQCLMIHPIKRPRAKQLCDSMSRICNRLAASPNNNTGVQTTRPR